MNTPKILWLTARDPWLRKFIRNLTPRFFDSLGRTRFSAVICPNLSAYEHAEHRVWLTNRALIQNFQGRLLEWNLPGILFSYLEDSPEHRRWLAEYLQLNPTQEFVATGFDRGAANDRPFFETRLRMLSEAEQAVGRPLKVVLCSLMTKLDAIRLASALFPGRVYLVASTLFHHSIQGRRLRRRTDGASLKWEEPNHSFPRGLPLFHENARIFDEILHDQICDFYMSHSPENPGANHHPAPTSPVAG